MKNHWIRCWSELSDIIASCGMVGRHRVRWTHSAGQKNVLGVLCTSGIMCASKGIPGSERNSRQRRPAQAWPINTGGDVFLF